ncbi:MAG: cobyrinate a,c-diamide synthase [Phocaeicola sp.]
MKPQFLIGSAAPGSGKTWVTLALLRLLQRRGLRVQPYKCGADYVDAHWHGLAAVRDAVHVDAWMGSPTHLQTLYNRYGEGADVCVTEGATALLDGYNRTEGSSAEVAKLLQLPVILVVNARGMGYSVAPLLYGYKQFHIGVKMIGVIFTQVSSTAQYDCLKEACSDAGVEALGYLPVLESGLLPSRYVALTQSERKRVDDGIEELANQAEKWIEIDKLLNLSQRNFPCAYTLPYTSEVDVESMRPQRKTLRIAVARDPAFSFIYRENLAQLSKIAQITFFSPIYANELPEADIIWLPGGFPELFARQLQRRKRVLKELKAFAEGGGKILAEGGGMFLLARTLKLREEGSSYAMSAILPLDITLAQPKPFVGYRELIYREKSWRGHECRYSSVADSSDVMLSMGHLYNHKGQEVKTSFYRYKNVLASYMHLYWGEKDFLSLWE